MVGDPVTTTANAKRASLRLSLSKPRPGGYSITVFDDTGGRRYCSTTTTATTIPLVVTRPADQARTYTAYVARGSCPSTVPPAADQSAAITVHSGIDNPAHADLALIAAAAATTLTSAQTCTELSLSPTATHDAGSSLSDQQLACEAALAAGKPLNGALAQAVVNTGGAGTVWWLLHQITTDPSVTAPPAAHPDPGDGEDRTAPAEIMPTTLDPAWRIDDLTEHLLDHNPDAAMDSGQARTVATHCAWRTARAGRNAYHDCSTLPIFASGNDVKAATLHDAEALDVWAPWVHLNRGTPAERGWHKDRCDLLEAPDLPDLDFPSGRVQCDEYPFLSTDQGGPTATPAPHLKKIDADDNQYQGSLLGSFFTLCHLSPKGSGKPFLAIPLVGTAPNGNRTVLPVATQTRLCNGS